jgi:rhamnose transport system permease protein
MKALLKQRELWLLAVIVGTVWLVSLRSPAFIHLPSLANILNDTSILIMLALGQMVVILTRSIDLSMAANLALSGMVVALLNIAFPALPVPVLVLAAALLGTALGAINGLLVWKLSIPPIVVTLGTLTIYRGMIFVIAGGSWVNAHQMTDAFKALPRMGLGGITMLSWFAIVAVSLFYVLMTRTALGRAFYATGINPTAATYVGIDVGKTRFIAFCVSGLVSGIAGYLWIARYAVAYVDVAGGFELTIIAACVIGGISIAGGIGSVAGAVLGALFLGVINNALPVVNISPFWQMAISGLAILLAVIFNARTERKRGRIILKQAEHAA